MKMPSRVLKTDDQNPLIEPKAAKSFITREKIAEEEAIRQISLKISETLLSRCDAAAKLASVTRSSYIKMAILEKLEKDGR